MRYDYLLFIGRFQPFHKGHRSVVQHALAISDKLIMLVGSAYQPRTVRNPWDYQEREAMIRSSFSETDNKRIIILPLLDNVYNDAAWIRSVQQIVSGVTHAKINTETNIGLIGHQKDESSFYLNQFPQWKKEEVENYEALSSTDIREVYFDSGEIRQESLDQPVIAYLEQFKQGASYKQVAQEQKFVRNYKKGWESAPYEPTFVTVDALVIQSGHILLVERKAQPGRGLKALPGGFVNPKEKLKDAVIRELREETRIKVPAPVLEGSITKSEVFDDPYRSARGRTITHAYLIELHDEKLPKVKGGDDAAKAFWVPFADVKPEEMFEDHFHIIQAMLG